MAKQLSSSVDTKSKQILKRTASSAMEDAQYIHVKKPTISKSKDELDTKDSSKVQLSSQASSLSSKCGMGIGEWQPPSTTLTDEQKQAICELSRIGPAALLCRTADGSKSVSTGRSVNKHTTVSVAHAVDDIGTAANPFVNFTNINLGTGPNERIGVQVRLKHLIVRGEIGWDTTVVSSIPVAANALGMPVRFLIVLDKFPVIGSPLYSEGNVGSPASPNTICYGQQVSTDPLNTYLSYNYLTKESRYVILHDEIFTAKWNVIMGPGNSAAPAAYGSTVCFERKFDLKDVIVQFTGVLANTVLTNQVFGIAVANTLANPDLANPNTLISLCGDLTYSDDDNA